VAAPRWPYAHFLPLDENVRPEGITQHGTKVVLLGNEERTDTTQRPPGTASSSKWISKYLNSRYYRFPEGVTVMAREWWKYTLSRSDRDNLRTLTGQERYLAQHAVTLGDVTLTGAIAHWWILRDEPAITKNSGFVESAGHVAALYQNELYELSTARAGMSRLQQFGVTFGYRYVVIYVEPVEDELGGLTTDTARTSLLVENKPLPWTEWASEFRENLPDPINALVAERAAAAAGTDHGKSIRERLAEIMTLFKISRYRPASEGGTLSDPARTVPGGQVGATTRSVSDGSGRRDGAGGRGGNVYAVFERSGGSPERRIRPDPFPHVTWVSRKDGTREYGDIEDRAAKFLPDQNLLLVNADFRVFDDMIGFFEKQFADVQGVTDLARETVRAWFEQTLVETVIGVQGLINSKEWSQSEIDVALSEEALTSAVMQRYHVHFAVKRELASRLGSRRTQAAG